MIKMEGNGNIQTSTLEQPLATNSISLPDPRSTTVLPYLALCLLHAGQIAPLFNRLGQVDLVQSNLDFANLIVLGESVRVG